MALECQQKAAPFESTVSADRGTVAGPDEDCKRWLRNSAEELLSALPPLGKVDRGAEFWYKEGSGPRDEVHLAARNQPLVKKG